MQLTTPTVTRALRRSVTRNVRVQNAIQPFARSGPGSVPSFFEGWLMSELPLHAAAVATLASVRAAKRGALRTPAGVAAVTLNAVAAARLVQVYRDATDAATVLDEALRAELGTGYLERIDPARRFPNTSFPLSRLVQPFPTARRSLCVAKDLAYGPAGKRNRLDVWRRPDLPADGAAPVLLQIHGGAWMIGEKEQQGQPLMTHLTEQGWVCVAINYRLSPRATWPDHAVDVKKAIAWIKANIHQYGGDPNFIAVSGGSAGGHLTALAALSANDPRYQPGFEDADTTVQAAVPIYGVYDFTNRDGSSRADMLPVLEKRVFKSRLLDDHETWDFASPMGRVHADAPPFFAVHGSNDSLAPVEQARAFVEMLRKESGAPVAYAELPGAQHAFDVFWSPRTHATVQAIGQFLNLVYSERATHR